MKAAKKKSEITTLQAVAIILAALVGLNFLGYFDPVPERAPDTGGVFVYYGAEGETVPASAVPTEDLEQAKVALADAAYFGAYAVGTKGRSGIWIGARTRELARTFALAQCGDGCTLVAERLPLHRDASRPEPVLTHAMATNLGVNWPFTKDVLAVGGANAWGHSAKSVGKAGWRSAMRKAGADCESRRAVEAMPDAKLSEPCMILTLEEIIDLRPKKPLYPAAFTIELSKIAPAIDTEIVAMPDAPSAGPFGPYLPPRLYGARAATSATTDGVVREAGWPLAGEAIALLKCNAGRRPKEEPCIVTHKRLPSADPSAGILFVSPELYASFLEWENTKGAGAFAISPYGAWGFSYHLQDKNDAIQKAVDWCWYHTQKNWEYRQVKKAFLDAGLDCRIIALREG